MSKYAGMTVGLVHKTGNDDPRRYDALRTILCGRQIVEVEVTVSTDPLDDGEDDAPESAPTPTA